MKTPEFNPQLQQYLRSGPVLKCYEVLKNEGLCLWIDTVKPRVFTLFSFGTFGPFQNILYNSDSNQLRAGHWGIYPYGQAATGQVFPFQSGFRDMQNNAEFRFEPEEIQPDYGRGALSLKGMPAFGKDQQQCGRFDWDIRLEGDTIVLQSGGPTDATGFKLWLYPLYDWADCDGQAWPLCYYADGCGRWDQAKVLALADTAQRMPALRLEAPGGTLRVRSSADTPHGAARRLEVESFGQGRVARLILRVLANKGQVSHSFPKVPEASVALLRMADAVCNTVKQTAAAWPAVAGVIPDAYHLGTLAPFLREENYAAVCYMPRVAMLMSAAALHTGERHYVDVMFAALEKYRTFCKFFPDGRIGYPMAISPAGVVQEDWKPLTRSCDYAIAARGYFYLSDAYAKLGDPSRSALALERARDLGLALAAIQGPDGSFSTRYDFENPKWTGQGNGGLFWVLWQLQERLAVCGNAGARKICDCVLNYVAFELDRRKGPSALRVPGPGTSESIPMFHDDFAGLAYQLLVRHLATDDPQYAELAKQASACAVFAGSNFYIDQPEAFAFPLSAGMLALWCGGVRDTIGKGGMFDKLGNETLLALATRLNDPLSAQVLQWRWYSRLAWSLEPSGGMNTMDIKVPGYSYRNTQWAEELNWGGVGFAAHLLL
ncbi:MAG: hypothetical protein KKG09_09145 [Verrucomicrobia bacterium]|nr:hypothetical protein [Verrucomicrobiota bacterium]MBU4247044.1 hypothetical protein [Verrucomicrobiota bacterium]MBU4291118.1 hypothetical protein [Verrucomicrobiota bacterium]MBU4498155.1 hypothetical protein [Verrucomicrobiota bacterium]MCG2680135.1 hypothetical protein [Kiritimatiellia bacterium]